MDIITPLLVAAYQLFVTALVTGVQIICWPINLLISAAFPSLSSYITTTVATLTSYLNLLSWVLTFIPPAVVTLLLFILGCELVFLTLFQSSYYVSKLWLVVQKIKVW